MKQENKSVQIKVESGSAELCQSSSTSPIRIKQEITNDILTPPDTPTKKEKIIIFTATEPEETAIIETRTKGETRKESGK